MSFIVNVDRLTKEKTDGGFNHRFNTRSSHSSGSFNHFNIPKRPTIETSYPVYYLANLFYNLILLSLYMVMVFTSHPACRTRSGYNGTDKFHYAFIGGFIILAADFAN